MRSFTLALIFAGAALAQAPVRLEFEVATIKPAAPITGPSPGRSGPGSADPLHVNYRSLSMKNLLMAAYDLPIGRITGPGWIDSDRYDVVASLAPGTTKEQLAAMLQNLLADRFGLAVHRETRDMALFELTVGKSQKLGPGLKSYVEDTNAVALAPGQMVLGKDGKPVVRPGGLMFSMGPGRREVSARKQTMVNLVTFLAAEFGRPVIDRTGLTGDYDYTMEYLPEGPLANLGPQAAKSEGNSPAPAASEVPSLQSAVQEQLGLHLESKRGPVEVLVVDRGDKTPSEN